MGMSVAGILVGGYFFAFHLLNIVNTNQLLKGVIQAVAQNGKSVIIYHCSVYSISGQRWAKFFHELRCCALNLQLILFNNVSFQVVRNRC
jgi:hypothetical protein